MRNRWTILALGLALMVAPAYGRAPVPVPKPGRDADTERLIELVEKSLKDQAELRDALLKLLKADAQKAEEMAKRLAEAEARVRAAQAEAERARAVAEAERARALAVEAEAKAVKARSERLEQVLAETMKELAKFKAEGKREAKPEPRPAPDNIEGTITKVDKTTGLVVLSVGSDAGLTQGHTLEVFRLGKDKAQYLGRLDVVEVKATEAIARPQKGTKSPIEPGDRVASRIAEK